MDDPGRSSNGKTADSGSAYRGSSPCLPANPSLGLARNLPILSWSFVAVALRSGQSVEPVYERDIGTRNQMAIDINGHLN